MSTARKCDVCEQYGDGKDWWHVSNSDLGSTFDGLFGDKKVSRYDVCSLECLAGLALDLSAEASEKSA